MDYAVAGVVNPSNNNKYSHKLNNDLSLNSEEWLLKATEHKGSWWNYWLDWLIKNGDNNLIESSYYQKLKKIEDAPGSYVKK